MKSMKDLPKEERPAFGQLVNEVKTLFANAIEERRAVLEVAEMEKRIAEEKLISPCPVRSRIWAMHIH